MKPLMAAKPCIFLIGIILFFACSRSDNKTGGVETPVLEKKCIAGACVPGQFVTAYQRFVLVSGDMVNLRSGPSATSRIITRLPVTRKVTVLQENPGDVTVDGAKGRWAFVQVAADINIRGWVFNRFLGYVGCFTKVERLRIREIRVILGGKLTVYKCTPDGRFEYIQTAREKKNNQTPIRGEIMQCHDVIWLKKDLPDDYPVYFHVLKNGNLELPDQYKDRRGIVITNR
jgi:hypothetical protein